MSFIETIVTECALESVDKTKAFVSREVKNKELAILIIDTIDDVGEVGFKLIEYALGNETQKLIEASRGHDLSLSVMSNLLQLAQESEAEFKDSSLAMLKEMKEDSVKILSFMLEKALGIE